VIVTGRDGTTIADSRLVSGAGAVPVTANPDGATLRFLDDAGTSLAKAPLTGPGD